MKKLLSIIICMTIILSCVCVSFSATSTQISLKQAIERYEANSGEKVNTNRYYFLMPDGSNGDKGDDEYWPFYEKFVPSWFNDSTSYAGIYWWDTGKVDPDSWPGFKMMKGDSDAVFYADVPDFVETVIFNNNVDGGFDPDAPVYNDAHQCREVYLGAPEVDSEDDEYQYLEGIKNYDNMIYVIDPDIYLLADSSSIGKSWWGEWYFYYGNGCYGKVKNGNETNCIRDDHDHENLYINFDPSNTGWTDYEKIYCNFAHQSGSGYYPIRSTATLCTDYDGDGIYTYDLNKSEITLTEYTRYSVSFCTDNYQRTSETIFQTGNLKDTIYSTGEYHTWDRYKEEPIIKWTNEIPIELRPIPSLKEELKKYDNEHGTTTPTHRYYFLMPNGENGTKGDINEEYSFSYYNKFAPSWYNEYADKAGIYWWDQNTLNPSSWPGYTIEQGDSECVFYADVPQCVETIIFNNAIDGGMNSMFDIYYSSYQSCNIPCYIDEEFPDYYPIGAKNFDNMIFVINPSLNNENDLSSKSTFGGEWYYYYGDGCYGEVKDGDTDNCLRDDHDHGRTSICKDEFLEFCNITEDDSHYYSGPLYYHYENDEENPSWFFAKGESGYSEYKYFYGTFGDYLLYETAVYSPSRFPYLIYSYDDQKFYTLEDAWDNDIDGIDEIFSNYLCPQLKAKLIGDADNDHVLSVMDATTIQMAQADMIRLYDKVSHTCYYGDAITSTNDFDRDGVRSVMDATAIQQRLAMLA